MEVAWDMIAGLDKEGDNESIPLAQLIRAQGGSFEFFEEMNEEEDVDVGDRMINRNEFMSFILMRMDTKGPRKGESWIKMLLQRLRSYAGQVMRQRESMYVQGGTQNTRVGREKESSSSSAVDAMEAERFSPITTYKHWP